MSNGNMSTGVKIILGLIMFAIGAALILSATTGTSCVPACAEKVKIQKTRANNKPRVP